MVETTPKRLFLRPSSLTDITTSILRFTAWADNSDADKAATAAWAGAAATNKILSCTIVNFIKNVLTH